MQAFGFVSTVEVWSTFDKYTWSSISVSLLPEGYLTSSFPDASDSADL
jgi:hypothetical protein